MSKKYIDADDIEYTKQTFCYGQGWYEDEEYVLKNEIDEMPAADVRENVRGEWLPSNQHGFFAGHRIEFPDVCSVCGRSALNEQWHFCPNCGADMRGEEHGRD